MRIALLYPPPWKIPRAGEAPFPRGEGAPAEYRDGDLDADFFQTPYGLFSLAAQAMRLGHQVKVINMSAYPWQEVERVVSALDAELFGMSCWTANRRGVAMTADLIRSLHPAAHVVVGGPHATPFAKEMLEHHANIDTVTMGESEETFLELIERLERREPTTGIKGSAYRASGEVFVAPERASIRELDQLASPHDYFGTHILMTSRGCPWQCTFCGAETTWGRGFRGQSVKYVVDAIESALAKLPVRMIQIKDDTFTANKKRALEICREIRRRNLQFFWSCDTRVDVLNEDLLLEMRLAGCQRLSLGVESGSNRILANIDKKITADEIIEAANMAKSVGIQVRFYMMLGNRGETQESFQETLDFLKLAKPHQYVFSCLSVYPGTRDFDEAVAQGWLSAEHFFRGDFQEFKTPFDATEELAQRLGEWFSQNKGLQEYYIEDVAAARSILEKVGDYHAAHMDMAGAYFRERQLDLAEKHARRALELGYPVPGLAYNYLACVALGRGDVQGMQDHFMTAAKTDPQHHVLMHNVERARAWFRERGPERNLPITLSARHDFQLLERTHQPTLPGPLPDDFADWGAVPQPAPRTVPSPKEVMLEGHDKQGFPQKRLRVLA